MPLKPYHARELLTVAKVAFTRRNAAADATLKEVLAEKIPKERERILKFRKEFGALKTGETTIETIYNGMRDVPGLICETSLLDPNEGIRFRGFTIPECQQKLPKMPPCGEEPMPEGLFWLLMTGDIPTQEQAESISCEWAARSKLPPHIVTLLKNFPKTLHPMSQFSCAITALNHESKFAKAYMDGVKKQVHWETTYEDAMDLIGKLNVIAAYIYMHTYRDGKVNMDVDPKLDWTGNFAKMMAYDCEEFVELLRLYLTIHSDHDGGNVSAHTTHLVGSALSDPYLSFAAGINGLAGPLHGLANQLVLNWIKQLQKDVGTDDPSEKQLIEFVDKWLKSGQVVPGYGHAVLRKTDPRFICQRDFANKHLPDDPTFKVVSNLFKIVPPILEKLGKVKNPWPNVDAHSGVLLLYYGMKEMNYYTVLFGVSRALGVLTSLVWDRAMMRPIERPKSFTTEKLMKIAKEKGAPKKDDKKKK